MCNFFSPLKNISGRKCSHVAPPHWYHKQSSVSNVGHTVGKGSNALEWAPEDGGLVPKAIWCCILFFILPLKIWVNKNLVMPRPPDDIINKRAYLTSNLLWGRGLLRWNGHWRTGGGAESQFDCRVFFSNSPLTIMIDGNLVFPRPPDDIVNKWAYLRLDIM